MQGARSIALQTLSFFDTNGYISFKKVEMALSTLSSSDRSFCVNLIYGVLRKRIRIDYELSRFLAVSEKTQQTSCGGKERLEDWYISNHVSGYRT